MREKHFLTIIFPQCDVERAKAHTIVQVGLKICVVPEVPYDPHGLTSLTGYVYVKLRNCIMLPTSSSHY